MRIFRIIAVALLVTCLPNALFAASPSGFGSFSKYVPGTDKQVPIDSATIADNVVFHAQITAEDGEHKLTFNVYDGNGREVMTAETVLVVRGGRGARAMSYGFDRVRDVPGVWWYVAALDGQVVVSNSLQVSK